MIAILIALTSVLSSIPCIIIEYKKKSPYFLFVMASSIIFIVPNFLNSIFELVPQELTLKAALYFSLFNCFYFIFRLSALSIINVQFDWNYESNINTLYYKKYKLTYVLSYLFVIVVAIYSSIYAITGSFSLSSAMASSWWDTFRTGSRWQTLSFYLFYISGSLVIICSSTRSKVLCVVLLFGLAYTLFVLRSRTYFIAYAAPFFVYYCFTKLHNLRQVVNIILAIVFVLIGYSLTREIRISGGLIEFISGDIVIADIVTRNILEGGEFERINGFYKAISGDVSHEDFYLGNNIIRTILMPFPSSFTFGVKPSEITYAIWDAYRGRSEIGGQSYHPTIYGLAFFDLGWLSVVIYPAFLVIIFCISEVSVSKMPDILRINVLSVMCLTALVLSRGAFYNAVAFWFWPFVMLYLVSIVFYFLLRVVKKGV
ncbi:conserved membrane hypothetical protein [Vibrio chagasii]|nr:conserved membrane hypothetical protein [Vibrio chagasii]CAH6905508.1 conserved membrane hypothetical protein [Vibrio chagasii]CAH6990527.1 conserved membrane hypothetical protein [Vibrio chagasii]CAH7013788.1 conserved membrane hypothetical protein [Vibrio chagasii]